MTLYAPPKRHPILDHGWWILCGWKEIAMRMRCSQGAAKAFFKKHGIPRSRQGGQVRVTTGILDRAILREGFEREEKLKQKIARGEMRVFQPGNRYGKMGGRPTGSLTTTRQVAPDDDPSLRLYPPSSTPADSGGRARSVGEKPRPTPPKGSDSPKMGARRAPREAPPTLIPRSQSPRPLPSSQPPR